MPKILPIILLAFEHCSKIKPIMFKIMLDHALELTALLEYNQPFLTAVLE